MNTDQDKTRGVAEDTAAFERSTAEDPTSAEEVIFHARPSEQEPDWLEMSRDIRRRFPKVLARLAE